jgi:hypothetical protein
MNSRPISSYEDLCNERERLTELLKSQRAQIHRDVEEIKNEFRPMISLSENVSKLLSREDGKDPLIAAGTNIGIDILAGKLFQNSNFILRFILPSILKNISSHLLPDATGPLRRPLVKKTIVERTIVREQRPVQKEQKPVLSHK